MKRKVLNKISVWVITLVLVVLVSVSFATYNADILKLVRGIAPQLEIGNDGEVDTQISFKGNAVDYHMGIDDSADAFLIGYGTAMGTTPAIGISSAGLVDMKLGSTAGHSLVAATNTLTTANCGSKVTIGHATEFVTTLPAATAGCEIEFGILLAPSGADYTIVTAASANVIYGSLVVNGAVVPCVTEDTITSTGAAGAIGDTFKVWSDGTNWYVSGDGVAATAWTCTAT